MDDVLEREVIRPVVKVRDGQWLLFDAQLADRFEPADFQPGPAAAAPAGGRGSAWRVTVRGRPCVLRHYRRGGLVEGLLGDRYPWAGLERSRPFREWRLLVHLRQLDLPVPPPVAARVVPAFPFYRGDLITQLIPDARTLAETLAHEALTRGGWEAVGRCVRRFHRHGVCHADLNAHNIMVDASGAVHLIDFDRGRLRRPGGRWQEGNVRRLRRSLHKLAARGRIPFFRPGDIEAFLTGYRTG